MYDVPEAKDREADKLSVLALLKTVHDLETRLKELYALEERLKTRTDLCYSVLSLLMTRLLLFSVRTYYIFMISLKEF